jgi:ABC-type multidrug transport system ATPase subunit
VGYAIGIPSAGRAPTGVTVIEARNLSKRYGAKLAVDGLAFTVSPGKVTGLLGPDGAGKTTTMRLLLGLARPDSGEARIDGTLDEPVNGLDPAGHQEAADLLSPWQGFGVCCLWTALLLAAAACVLGRRDV